MELLTLPTTVGESVVTTSVSLWFVDLMNAMMPSIIETLVSILVLVGILVLRPIRYAILRFFSTSMSKTVGFKVMSNEDTLFHLRIHNEVIGLRYSLKADSVSIFQFENGNRFSLSSPTWKITQTYEAVADGRMCFSNSIKREPVSQFLEMIIPLFNPHEQYQGVERRHVKKECGAIRTVFKSYETALPDCRYKYELLKRGAKTSFLIPLKNEAGNLFAICSVSYTYEKSLTDEDLSTCIKHTDKIQACLNSIFVDSLKR